MDFLVLFFAQPIPDVPGVITAFGVSTAAGIGAAIGLLVNFYRTSNAKSVFDGMAAVIAAVLVAALAEFGLNLNDGFQFNDVVLAIVAGAGALSPMTGRVGTEVITPES